MKCVLKNQYVDPIRVTNKKAEELVKKGWVYCSKALWKVTGRKRIK